MKQTLLVMLGLMVGLTACASPTPTPAPAPKITVDGVWGRTSPMMAQAGAFYMVIHNTGTAADRLTGGKSTGCGSVELHETYQMDNGAMGMRPVTGGALEVPANGQVELKAGSYHIMCIDKKVDFTPGTKIPLTLVFEKSGEVNVTVDVRDQGM